jgi:adenylylsulfate kinase
LTRRRSGLSRGQLAAGNWVGDRQFVANRGDTVAVEFIWEIGPVDKAALEDEISILPDSAVRKGLTVWFTGLSGAGKTTICRAVEAELLARGVRVEVLDGDIIRTNLCSDLGFSEADRKENIKRIAYVAQLLTRNGILVLVAAISPYRSSRDEARTTVRNFMEVYVNAPLQVCEARDPKGLYRRARSGKIQRFTGIDQPYEAPLAPEVECHTDVESAEESSGKVIASVLRFLSVEIDA